MGNGSWRDEIEFGVGYATGNPLAAKVAGWAWDAYTSNKPKNNTGHPSGGTADGKPNYNYGDLASITMQAAAARKSRKQQAQATQNTGKLDLGYLRQEAENNGFNPLTVLQSTGGAGSTKSSNAGLLASSQFWATYADGLGELNNRQYEQRLINADKKPEKTEREKFIDRYKVPLLVPVTTGGMDGETNVNYMTINPELMETRMSELMGSMFVQGLQASYQNGIEFQVFVDGLQGIPPAVKKSLNNLYQTFDGKPPSMDKIKQFLKKEMGDWYNKKANQIGETLESWLPKKNSNGKIITTPIDQQKDVMEALGL